MDSQHSKKAKLCSPNHQKWLNIVEFQKSVSSVLFNSIDISREPHSSTWLHGLPLKDHDFLLHKVIFVMLSAYDMVGFLLYCQGLVCVMFP